MNKVDLHERNFIKTIRDPKNIAAYSGAFIAISYFVGLFSTKIEAIFIDPLRYLVYDYYVILIGGTLALLMSIAVWAIFVTLLNALPLSVRIRIKRRRRLSSIKRSRNILKSSPEYRIVQYNLYQFEDLAKNTLYAFVIFFPVAFSIVYLHISQISNDVRQCTGFDKIYTGNEFLIVRIINSDSERVVAFDKKCNTVIIKIDDISKIERLRKFW